MSEIQITTTAAAVLDRIPLSRGELHVTKDRVGDFIALRHACDTLNISFSKQLQKLKSKHWATVAQRYTVSSDGKKREMIMVTRDTFTMWLATIEPTRVKEEARETLMVFQKEAVAALDSYFHEGGAIDPNATEDQLDRLARIANARMQLIERAKGIIQPDYLEAQARIVLAEGMGTLPQLDSAKLPLEVDGYLREMGVSQSDRLALRASFGNRLSGLYSAEYGEKPMKAPKTAAGSIREVNTYTEEHRHLFDRVFSLMGIDVALEVA